VRLGKALRIRQENYFKNIKIGAKYTTHLFETTIWTQIQSVEVESHIGQDKTDTSTTNKISRYEAGQIFFKQDQPKMLSGHDAVLRQNKNSIVRLPIG
jgi:hypothetical protein